MLRPKSVVPNPNPVTWFVIFGQSNARGSAEDTIEEPWYECVSDQVWNWDASTSSVEELADPFAHATFFGFNAKGSMAPRLADYLRANGYGSVGFIPIAQGGTQSSEFLPGTDLYNEFVTQVTAALAAVPESTLAGVIIYQGESDATNGAPAVAWNANWTTTMNGLDTEFGALKTLVVRLPLVAGGSLPQAKWDQVIADQDDFVAARPNPGADNLIVQSPPTPTDGITVALHHSMGADDTEGFRKLAVDVGAAIVANW